MKTVNLTTITMKAVLSLIGVVALIASCAKLPVDNTNPKIMHSQNLRGSRYAEIFLVSGNSITGNLSAAVYNTTGLNEADASSRDSAPQALMQGLDTKALKKQLNVLGVSINGPKQWMLDWVDIPVGAERDFDGLKARWVAVLNLKGVNLSKKTPYTPITIARKSAFGYNKGTTVFLIDDADGNTWIMKGFELGMQPKWTYEEFAADPAGHFKHLPPGWKFRTKVLDKDLILVPETGIATIMSDEFLNVYDKTGPGYSNYKP